MAGVLVFTPTWRGVDPDVQAALVAQLDDVPGAEWVIDDRNPYPAPDYRNIRVKMQDARLRTLAGQFDGLVTVDADCIIPPDGLRALVATTGDVVYTPTMIRHGARLLSLWQYCGDRNVGMSLSNYPDELAAARAAGVWRVSGIGWSFTLIRRHVLEALDFRDDNDRQACDVPFAEDALRAGFVSMANLTLPVVHIDADRGERLAPWEATMQREYVVLETVNAVAAGRFVALVAGDVVTLTDAEAADLVCVGYVAERQAEIEMAVDEGAGVEHAVSRKRRKAK
mgnify:CR=1 FL=1